MHIDNQEESHCQWLGINGSLTYRIGILHAGTVRTKAKPSNWGRGKPDWGDSAL